MRRPPLPHALEKARHPRIEPVFLPFAGCGARCVFCAQEIQTGTSCKPIVQILDEAHSRLAWRQRHHPSTFELAFYGGTFTALEPEDFSSCLAFARFWRERGVLHAIRCSTRPDTVDPKRLAEMAAAGFTTVELGAQSFDDTALALCGRPYTARDIERAVDRIHTAGLTAGLQLLPGMPGLGPERFMLDMEQALDLRPACLRLYPCLVIEGTPLAQWWRDGTFTPWTLETTVDALARALRLAWKAEVPVIRTGLAPEADLSRAMLAGPTHPALGQMVTARALFFHIRDWLAESGLQRFPEGDTLELPAHMQGLLFGQKNSLLPDYAALGVHPKSIVWRDGQSPSAPAVLTGAAIGNRQGS